MQAFADVVRAGKALYVGVSEWNAQQLRAGHALAQELGISLISNQPQYSMLWRVIESEVVPASEELGISQIVWSPVAQGVLTGKYRPGVELPAGSRATDSKGGAEMISRFMRDDVLAAVQLLEPVAKEAGLTMAQLAVAWVLQNPNVASARSVPRGRSRCGTTSGPRASPSTRTPWPASMMQWAGWPSAIRARPVPPRPGWPEPRGWHPGPVNPGANLVFEGLFEDGGLACSVWSGPPARRQARNWVTGRPKTPAAFRPRRGTISTAAST